MIAALLVVGSALAAVAWWRQRAVNSSREDDAEADPIELALGVDLSSAEGWPYFAGRGSPSTPWEQGPDGVDCSGFLQMAWVELGLLSPDEPDRTAAALADLCLAVAVGDQQPGDAAYYPGHVMLVVGPAGPNGHSPVMGASGGDLATFGNDPDARVKYFDSAAYRGDFVTYMRIPEV